MNIKCSKPRGTHKQSSIEKGALKNFSKFPEKQLCGSLFLNKFTGLKTATLSEKDSSTEVFL